MKVLPFLLPIFSKDGFIPPKLARALGSAMWTYDLTGGARIGKLHKRISADQAVAYMPTLPRDRLAASYLYYDAQADDARLTLTVARTAAIEHGAVVVNDCEVVGLRKDARGMADGATVRADGQDIEVDATVVVNAAGVWSDEVRALDEGQHPHTIRPAKGIHITVPWRLVRNEIAVVIPVPKDSRSVFVVGWGDFTYIGTTDTDYDGPLDDPQCTPDDIAYLLRAINGSCSNEITEADIVGTWAGLRPLVADAHSEKTADLSRRHKVARSASGVITITGGKLTTYRRMAADTVDAVVEDLGELPVGVQRRSRTKHLPLRGAEGFDELLARSGDLSSTLDRPTVEHLLTRYGSDARTVLAMIERRPELATPIVAGLPYLEAEVRYAARYEMARSVDDVLSRRTRARLLGRDDSAAAAPRVAELLAEELGWDADEQAAQVAAYRAAIEEERAAAHLPAVALEAVLGG